jgi:hypothetical protein
MLEIWELLHRLRDLGLTEPAARTHFDYPTEIFHVTITGLFQDRRVSASFAITEVTLQHAINPDAIVRNAMTELEQGIRGQMDQGN